MADQKTDEEETMLKTTESVTKETAITVTTNDASKDELKSKSSATPHERNQAKFAWACLILQGLFGVLYLVMVRYGKSADAKHRNDDTAKDELEENLNKYPCKFLRVCLQSLSVTKIKL